MKIFCIFYIFLTAHVAVIKYEVEKILTDKTKSAELIEIWFYHFEKLKRLAERFRMTT